MQRPSLAGRQLGPGTTPTKAIFVSRESFELEVPAALGEPGTRHWRVLSIPSLALWYIAGFEFAEDGSTFVHTMCF
jgi:hypothetical protein